MKDETVIVYDQDSGMGLIIYKEVAERKGVHNGQRLPSRKLAEVGAENAREGIARCELEITMNNFDPQ